MFAVIIRAILPIAILIGLGYLSRKKEILKQGDEKVLGSYLYYFALPALLFINIAETNFTRETLKFVFAGMLPVFAVIFVYLFSFAVLRFSKDKLYFLMVTFFGNFVFFGIPFVMFVFPGREGEGLAILSSASISVLGVFISVLGLELSKIKEKGIFKILKTVTVQLLRNPLILSILAGLMVYLFPVKVPQALSSVLHMLGGTTSTVAIFMLGAFLYGRKYVQLGQAFMYSLTRMALMPAAAYAVTLYFGLSQIQSAVIVLMHAMPLAIAVSVLSDKYDFHEDTVASVILITSVGAIIYLPVWIFILGIR
ncbi:MAG: hypothetical protein A2252_09800 [Elusimicrobia bacterium RIFOXYA2_FULL_39_19]|nr:MAG: hypothetical protein A2252_09800 [Elusimicrobia bacterium RIFOXYA2_FULL_39_19]